MFKRFVMAFVIVGLISGSVFADTTNPKQTIKDNLVALKDSLHDSAEFHACCAVLGGFTCLLGIDKAEPFRRLFKLKPYGWDGYTNIKKLAFYTDLEKTIAWEAKLGLGIFAVGAVIAVYNAYQAYMLNKRAQMIENIKEAVKQDANQAYHNGTGQYVY